ncbi:MAG: ribonuclease T2 [Rhizobiales bacterium]|nr:ribonuclease T2 [Hyphomicrobiales bacterium]
MFVTASRVTALAAVILSLTIGSTLSQDVRQQERRQHEPGRFDFYVLALSWSPSFCAAAHERNGRAPQAQCSARPYSFVVHGLWPQYERGFPRDCQVPAPRLPRTIMESMLDLMPSPRLVYNEWDRHGTCSGLGAADYFNSVRKARETVKIPPQFQNVTTTLAVTLDEVEEAFVKVNPGLSRGAIAVTCDSKRLSEVRVCFTKDFRFRDCAEIDRRACTNDKLTMPPVRGG